MIRRKLFAELKAHLTQREITFIVGPRQAGKTTLMLLLKEDVEKSGQNTVFFNLDIESDKQFFTSQEELLRKIRLELGEGEGYVFIDEVQRKEDAGLFLKGLYDMNLPYKFVVSGSGSVELKEKVHESLAGRKRIFTLSTLNFVEFIDYKTEYKYEDKLAEFFGLEIGRARRLLEEYLMFGGYPRVVIESRVEEKRKIISELYQSYLERDVEYLLGVKKTESFTSLVRLMAAQIGSLVNVSEIANTLRISIQTVDDYMWYMQKTFLLSKVTPYFKNIRKEITKSPVFYFFDLGMRNYALGTFGNPLVESDAEFLFQNFVYNILREKLEDSPDKIHFWRTTDKAEVDFIVDRPQKPIPIEVKYKAIIGPKTTRSFQSFASKYTPEIGYIVHLGEKNALKKGNTAITFLPYYQLLFEGL